MGAQNSAHIFGTHVPSGGAVHSITFRRMHRSKLFSAFSFENHESLIGIAPRQPQCLASVFTPLVDQWGIAVVTAGASFEGAVEKALRPGLTVLDAFAQGSWRSTFSYQAALFYTPPTCNQRDHLQ